MYHYSVSCVYQFFLLAFVAVGLSPGPVGVKGVAIVPWCQSGTDCEEFIMETLGLAQLCGQTDDPFQQSCLGWMPAAAVEPRKEAYLLVGGMVCTTEVL